MNKVMINYTKSSIRFFAIFFAFVALSSNILSAQKNTFSITLKNATLEQVFSEIEKQSQYRFLYNSNDVDAKQMTSIAVTASPLEATLDQLFKNINVAYKIEGWQIVLSPAQQQNSSTTKSNTRTSNTEVVKSGGGNSSAQTPQMVNVSGKVTDAETGEPMGFVTVYMLKADGKIGGATATDAAGMFKLNFTSTSFSKEKMEFKFLGYDTESYAVPSNGRLDVALKPSSTAVGQVVVTGYQTISKERATGSYEILGVDDFERKISSNITEALESRTPGVSTYGNNIVIRGQSTFSSAIGTQPLVVIDGFPTERSLNDVNMNDVETLTVLKDAAAAAIYGVRATNGVIVITTKSAARGENTKTTVQFTADWKWTQNPSLGDYHYANSGQIMDYEQELIKRSMENSNMSELTLLSDQLKGIGEAGRNSTTLDYYSPYRYARLQYLNGNMSEADYNQQIEEWKKTNYRKEYKDLVWRTPLRQSYNLSISSGSKRQSTYASINYTGNNHQIKTNSDNNLKAYIKSSQNISNWFSFDIGADIQYTKRNSVDGAYSDFTNMEPYTRIVDEQGNRVYRDFVDVGASSFYMDRHHINPKILSQIEGLPQFMPYRFNILDELDDNKNKSNNYALRSFVKLNFDIYQDLKFSTSFSYEFTKNRNETFMSADSYYMRFLRNRFASNAAVNSTIPAGGRKSVEEFTTDHWVSRSQLDYNKRIGDRHDITATAGFELKQLQSRLPSRSVFYGYDPRSLNHTPLNNKDISSNVLKQSYIYNNYTGQPGAILDGGYNRLSDPLLNQYVRSSVYQNRYVGMYAVAGYTYDGKYGVTGSIRVDQANLFGTDPKYRYRPLWSVGVKWNASREEFLKRVDWINMLDVRASYGLTGNVDQTTTPFLVAQMSSQNFYTAESIPTTNITVAPNPLLRWEKTASFNLGVDFVLLNGALSGKIDYYYKKSDDLLATIEVPFTSGYNSQRVNSAALTNQGFEFSISSPWYRKNGWTVTSSVMMSYNKNKVSKSYYNATQAAQLQSGGYYKVGNPLNALYAYRYGGLTSGGTDEQNGVPIIKRADGSSIVSFNDDGSVNIAPQNSMVPEDLVYMGSRTPTWTGSFTQSIQYGDWELSMLMVYYGGHKVYVPSFNFYQVAPSNTLPDWVGLAWTPDNPTSKVPKALVHYGNKADATSVLGLQSMYSRSTANVKSGDFIRIRNISLSYTLPRRFANKVGMQRLKMTAQVNNPWFWSKAGSKIDPETLSGIGDWTLPTATSYLLRLDIMF